MAAKPEPGPGPPAVDLLRLCRHFAEQSPQPMIAVEGAAHVVIYVNRAFERLCGKNREELLGRPFDRAVPEGKCRECLDRFDRVYRTGEPESLLEHEHTQTPPVYWSYLMWPILGDDRRPVGVMVQVTNATEISTFRRDVTAMNQALLVSSVRQHELTETLSRTVEALEQSKADLERAKTELELRVRERTAELEAAMEELKRSNEDLERFAHISSHDLQEPVRMVAMYTGMLAHKYKDKLDAEANECIDFAMEGAVRISTLIKDLLAYSRVNSEARKPQPTDSGAVVRQVLDDLQLRIRETNAQVTVGDLPTVPADATQLEQVFLNLIANALKYRRDEVPPRIHIAAGRTDGQWLFSVRDNGIGIDPKHYETIFVAFKRLHANRGKYPGTGIGLAIVKRIVERHGGRVCVDSKPGEGATFYFTLPAGE